ncbi:ribonucleoside-diphosphate reductase subunit alpha [Aliikangiella marina]|uniref:Ribonucleoside-diphosphate reductase n=1 Tax=Aliikangiella marina TaxID=1712262 RepID=A0A545T4X6_9GAMM|nr:ribonucleoside-diphosphate reductase subunit alpha [Aliikangiella marina]TQV72279.1 ribonucleoside-diphosphate reductase subunit alpha [Aliikangiella marina]
MLETIDAQESTHLGDSSERTPSNAETSANQENQYAVIRRNGTVTPFDLNKIKVAMTKAFLAVEGDLALDSNRVHQSVETLANQVYQALIRRLPESGVMHIEDIQDQVELALMRAGEQKTARAYVLYRAEHEKQRQALQEDSPYSRKSQLTIRQPDGAMLPLEKININQIIELAVAEIDDVSGETLIELTLNNVFDGMTLQDLNDAMVLAARSLIDQEPNYSQVAARLLLANLRLEALSFLNQSSKNLTQSEFESHYGEYFIQYVHKASELELLDEELTRFDLKKLAKAIVPNRDLSFNYLGLQTLYDRYFIHSEEIRFELPQAFFMRVAMGLAMNEIEREEKAIEFYKVLSNFDFMCSTPTLFNSGTRRPQLSSCYLTTVPDHLFGIYDAFRDNAMLSKFAGGLGNDWTRVRGMGSYIQGTNGKSQGVVPFLKVANDTAVAVNQGGKRKGAVCAYLETWHIDIEDFLELRKNTGDERRRTHDMNSANWIPDLFMQRVIEDQDWTLFSPEEVDDLHELSGQAFAVAYSAYEDKAGRGEITLYRTVKAKELWRKMLAMLFETGHPWITFKDPCNIRYTNQHQGVVHSSNLCTEITLHTSDDEIAVCNLGSVNLPAHFNNGELDKEKLERTITTAMRMLDNVIEYNYYSVPQARNSNLKHRPVGLGIMGFHDALYIKNIPYASEEAVGFADESMELVSYLAISASNRLAQERGRYSTFEGSLWSKGILPIDSVNQLAQERGNYFNQDSSQRLNWDTLRESIVKHGMRNSNCLAIAPTATISNICGVSQSIEPTYQNLYVKSNLSGEFSVANAHLIARLKSLGLWDEVMVNDLKYFDGSVQQIDRIPDDLKALFATAFEIDSRWLVEAASRRQKWIDQAQSLNLYMAEASGKKLDQLYKLAWVRGLKTTYYLRSLGATQMEKSTSQQSKLATEPPKVCSILEPDCEACQ